MAKKILKHYVFKSKPNPAKKELAIGSMICGIEIPHCTIELSPDDFAHARTQEWIQNTIMTHMSPKGALVIVIKPRIEGNPFHD